MDVSLTKEQEDAANHLVKAGLFASKEDAVARSHDWLREEVEKFESIQSTLELSAEQSARGESQPINAESIIDRLCERLNADSPDA